MKSTNTGSSPIVLTGSSHAFQHTLGSLPEAHSVSRVTVGGTFISAPVVIEGLQPSGSYWVPLLMVDTKTQTRSAGTATPADSTNTSWLVDTRGFSDIRVYPSSGTVSSGMGVEVTSGTEEEMGGPLSLYFSTTIASVSAGITFSGGTGVNLASIPDNLANAFDITESTNSYLKFVTTDGSEAVKFGKQLNLYTSAIIGDASGNELIKFPATVASAVNELTVANAATTVNPSITASGGDTDISVALIPKGLGTIRTNVQTDKRTQTAKTDTATLTIANLMTKVIDGTPTAAANYTLPTAANLVAGIGNCAVGDSFEFVINNKAAGAYTITVIAGSGGTADGTLTVAQDVIRKFVVIVTNVTGSSEAYFVYGLG